MTARQRKRTSGRVTPNDAVLFLDAHVYLDLYRLPSGKELLDLILEHQQHIFITEQIVNEVNRHKLGEVIKLFGQYAINLRDLPNQFFEPSGALAKSISEERLRSNKVLAPAIDQAIHQVSISDDVVSKALAPLFQRASAHKRDELRRAQDRHALGTPPGKGNHVGDQLNWEQLLSFLKKSKKRSVWLISRDGDYATKYGKETLLIPTLYLELKRLSVNDIRAFTGILDGIKDLAASLGVADKLPEPARIEEIKKEQEQASAEDMMATLPSLDWMTSSMALPIRHPRSIIAYGTACLGSIPPGAAGGYGKDIPLPADFSRLAAYTAAAKQAAKD